MGDTTAPTVPPDMPAPGVPAPSAPGSSGTLRFEPGTIVAGRYRLVALLGKGGMGEVYRADDLTLEQPVALKFLPAGMTNSAARLAQLHAELRVARQVSHKNVCRLYDLGDADGRRFITMEYIDGEDLASLLRRIGRIPQDKAIELARQLSAGLSAAHERGVLHRDLKPANVMIDGAGNVRLMDFGLAGAERAREGGLAGTPQYMAPEQLAGQPASVATDLYALGLVLFEIFTGRRVYEAKSLQEIVALHETDSRPTPSSIVRDLDPAIERVILRCLEKDPQRRPGSALAVAAALPGADPLAAALAAGETPSPELLIAAGETPTMPLGRALTITLASLAALVVFAVLAPRASVPALAPLARPPAVLIDRIQQMTAAFGYHDTPADAAYNLQVPDGNLDWLRDSSPSTDWWTGLRSGTPPALLFWYRTSPQPMTPSRPALPISLADPPDTTPGMQTVITDTEGRLVEFEAVPPAFEAAATAATTPPWKPLFDAAGLDVTAFHPVAPEWTPPAYADVRQAWEGPLAGRPGVTLRVEAAAYRGRPTFFDVIGPWKKPPVPAGESRLQIFLGFFNLIVWNLTTFGAAFLAWRHVRAHRADWRAATRLSFALFVCFTVGWLFGAHYAPSPDVELRQFLLAVAIILVQVAQVWVFYVAVEPYARRYWPDGLLGWSRLMSGRLRDPRVGRDILAGAAIGVILLVAEVARGFAPILSGLKAGVPPLGNQVSLLAHASALPLAAVNQAYNSLASGLLLALLFVILRLLVRRAWLAVALVVAVTTIASNGGGYIGSGWPITLIGVTVMLLITIAVFRFGLLTVTVGLFLDNVLSSVPLSHAPGVWWALSGNIALLLAAGIICFGFYAARTGQPIFGRLAVDD
ncbi:MAG: serine/threonine protein kinase [Acidobacteriota bacterium]|nr:serine/threonine protein kinase [Acidobacteriota bacterium]